MVLLALYASSMTVGVCPTLMSVLFQKEIMVLSGGIIAASGLSGIYVGILIPLIPGVIIYLACHGA